MTSEEQRRAFAEYMGGTAQSQAQAQTGQQYFYPVAPPAPTPPPAAASLAGGQHGAGQFAGGQFPSPSMSPPQYPPGYAPLARNYYAPSGASSGYSAGYQYFDPMASPSAQQNVQLNVQHNVQPAQAQAMAPARPTRSASGELVEAKIKEQYYRYEYPPPDIVPTEPPKPEEVPVLLCHTCSVCGQVRSAGYHRNHPIIPGEPLTATPCRRCKKKAKKEECHSHKYTHIRTCTADEPCDWPDQAIHVHIGNEDDRGRVRTRDVRVARRRSYSDGRPPQRGRSRSRLGLRILQNEQSPSRARRRQVQVRVMSMSPPPDIARERHRYDGVWPPPDIVPSPVHRHVGVSPPPDIRRTRRHESAHPPPGIHLSCAPEAEESPSSPTPIRRSRTRFAYEHESEEREPRLRSVSPIDIRIGRERRPTDAETRLAAHPQGYRPILRNQRSILREQEEIADPPVESPARGIPRPVGVDQETSFRRAQRRHHSEEGNFVEVGPRVQFGPDPTRDHRDLPVRDREPYRSTNPFAHDEPPSPPVRAINSLRILSPPRPRRSDTVRYLNNVSSSMGASRRESTSPMGFDEIRYRHYRRPPSRSARAEARLSPPPPVRPSHSKHDSYAHPSAISAAVPPKRAGKEADEVTESGSEHSSDVVDVRRWRGFDENGQPVMWVEETRTRLLDDDKDRGREVPLRPTRDYAERRRAF